MHAEKELIGKVLPNIENHLKLKQTNFICTEKDISFVDIQYYNEIQQLQLLDESIARQITK